MNADAREILNTALLLPDKDRANLAASLMESLDRPFNSDAQSAWADEIRRRLEDFDRGVVHAVPWDEARRIIAGQST
jgi:putative addiction module component (TIGR02574 family)